MDVFNKGCKIYEKCHTYKIEIQEWVNRFRVHFNLSSAFQVQVAMIFLFSFFFLQEKKEEERIRSSEEPPQL